MAKVTQENSKVLTQSLYYIDTEKQVYYILARTTYGPRFVSLSTGDAFAYDSGLGSTLKPLPVGITLKVVL